MSNRRCRDKLAGSVASKERVQITEYRTIDVQRGRLVSRGRLQLPAEMRNALSLGDGDTVLLEIVDGEIQVRPLRDAVSRLQARLREYVPTGVSLSDELIAERRAEAASD